MGAHLLHIIKHPEHQWVFVQSPFIPERFSPSPCCTACSHPPSVSSEPLSPPRWIHFARVCPCHTHTAFIHKCTQRRKNSKKLNLCLGSINLLKHALPVAITLKGTSEQVSNLAPEQPHKWLAAVIAEEHKCFQTFSVISQLVLISPASNLVQLKDCKRTPKFLRSCNQTLLHLPRAEGLNKIPY